MKLSSTTGYMHGIEESCKEHCTCELQRRLHAAVEADGSYDGRVLLQFAEGLLEIGTGLERVCCEGCGRTRLVAAAREEDPVQPLRLLDL